MLVPEEGNAMVAFLRRHSYQEDQVHNLLVISEKNEYYKQWLEEKDRFEE